MRQHGTRTALDGLGPHDHGCLAYSDERTFLTHGMAYLREGLAAGQRAMYVGSAPEEVMRSHLEGLGAADQLISAGALEVLSVADAYDAENDDDASTQAAVYDAAIQRALDDGYSGLRTLAEVTPLMSNAQAAARMARWEARADRMMAERPWSALCCYDRRRVTPRALADVAALHPIGCGTDDLAPFQVFSLPGDRMALTGSLDAFAVDDFGRLLEIAAPRHDFELDVAGLDFIDHNSVLAIARRAHPRGGGHRVTVTNVPSFATRVAEIVGVQL